MLKNEEIEAMDTSDTPWSWYYLADCGRWHRFEEDPHSPLRSEDIEKCYLKNPMAAVFVFSFHSCSKIDFPAMLLIDLITGRQRKVRQGHNFDRSCSCFNNVPVFKVNLTRLYQLTPLSELVDKYIEYDWQLDRSTILISRIQNLDLWKFFCTKKMLLMRNLVIDDIEGRRLLHGSKNGNVSVNNIENHQIYLLLYQNIFS